MTDLTAVELRILEQLKPKLLPLLPERARELFAQLTLGNQYGVMSGLDDDLSRIRERFWDRKNPEEAAQQSIQEKLNGMPEVLESLLDQQRISERSQRENWGAKMKERLQAQAGDEYGPNVVGWERH